MHESNQENVITTHNLSLGYDHTPLVTNVTVNIKSGEFVGILGPNGSGKSTFLRVLLGLIKPLSGDITVLHSIPTRGNMKIGYMPQTRGHTSIAKLTSRALLEASCDGLCYGLPILSTAKKNEIQKVLDIVEATPYADRPFQQLSGGEKQRIYLAQALLGKPRILLLDEPLAGLDPKYQDIFLILLKEIQLTLNVTILFTAHDPNPLLHIMNRVLFFANGKVAIGSTNEIITSETLSAIYGTPIEVIQFRDRIFVLSETQQNIFGEVNYHHD
jgi:zinc/manganese transport system ATP-binding protein